MTEPLVCARVDSLVGEMWIAATPEDGVVRAAGRATPHELALRLEASLAARGMVEGSLPDAVGAVEAWNDGDFAPIGEVAVAQQGGPFAQRVWSAMRRIPPGEPMSYQELAAAAGSPRAMRAAGTACARNAVGIFVPCHRVIGARGRLGSYGFGGVGIKAAMLTHEAGGGPGKVALALTRAHENDRAPTTVTT